MQYVLCFTFNINSVVSRLRHDEGAAMFGHGGKPRVGWSKDSSSVVIVFTIEINRRRKKKSWQIPYLVITSCPRGLINILASFLNHGNQLLKSRYMCELSLEALPPGRAKNIPSRDGTCLAEMPNSYLLYVLLFTTLEFHISFFMCVSFI